MYKVLKYFLLLTCVLSVSSCQSRQQSGKQPVEYVKGILSAPQGYLHGLVDMYDQNSKEGDIYVIGTEHRAEALGEWFRNCDLFDNVDGRHEADGLQDFCGEHISVLSDIANAPYQEYLKADNSDYLRELMVKYVLAAIDTTCSISPYDRNLIGRKTSAKMIVLSSPYAVSFGKFDIDTLFNSVGKKLPVICPVECISKQILAANPNSRPNVGVITLKGEEEAYNHLSVKMSTFVCALDSLGMVDPFIEFTGKYMAAGNTAPLDAIIVDDYRVDVRSFRETYASNTSVMSQESLIYAKFFASNLSIFDTMTTAAEACYGYLRQSNKFTHRISHPQLSSYMTVFEPEFDRSAMYRRTPASDLDTFLIIPFSSRYLSDTDERE